MINRGQLAVVQGMEVSEPFGCGLRNGFPACDAAQIDDWLDRLHGLGVRQLEITNKFDNALTGVAGDNGETGTIVDGANFLATGKFWDLKTCEDPAYHDHAPTTINYPHNDDMILANGLAALVPGGTVPVYPERPGLQHPRADAAGRARDRGNHRPEDDLRPRPHERRRPRRRSTWSSRATTRGSSPRTAGAPTTRCRGSTDSGA